MEVDALAKQFENFLDEAHRLKSKYASQIALLVGLETEYIHDGDLDQLDSLLERHSPRIEYLVGSVHHVYGIPIDFDLPTFHKALYSGETRMTEHGAQERLLVGYFDAQYRLLERFRPEIIGHLDLCRLYNPELRFADYPVAYEKMERNVRYAVEYGALFEINAAALKKNWETAYPGRDVVEVSPVPSNIVVASDSV
jgi:histidinol-phosphatase (PHP family)